MRLQSLFGVDDEGPLAELWFSGHPQFPSMLSSDGDTIDAATAIRRAPEFMISRTIADRWGDELPFLFKVISARKPLSLQVHPSQENAQEGFKKENSSHIDISDPRRSFKDAVAKHEMVVALEPFRASVGFMPIRQQIRALGAIGHPLARSMATLLSDESAGSRQERIYSAFRLAVSSASVMDRGITAAISEALSREGSGGDRSQPPSSAVLSALRHAQDAAQSFPGDPSTLCIAMMNPVELEQGGSVFIPAGTVHVYLRGTGAEIMTNSDNVLRAGMTPKHKDISGFMENFNCIPSPPIDPASGLLKLVFQADIVTYRPPLDEFMVAYGHVDPKSGATGRWWTVSDRLRRTQAKFSQAVGPQHVVASRRRPRVIVALDGVVRCRSNSHSIDLHQGEAVFIPASEPSVTVSGAVEEPGSYILATTAV